MVEIFGRFDWTGRERYFVLPVQLGEVNQIARVAEYVHSSPQRMSVGGKGEGGVCCGGRSKLSRTDPAAEDFEDISFFRFFDGNVCVERNGWKFAMSTVGQHACELSHQGETGIWTEVKRKGRHFSHLGFLGD